MIPRQRSQGMHRMLNQENGLFPTFKQIIRSARNWVAVMGVAACVLPAHAAEWTWTWNPGREDTNVVATVCPLKYGKIWAYAIEIDDGPKWVRSFAMPFLAEYHYTDSPPGVRGGRLRPFVGSVAVIVGVTDVNDAALNWDDLNSLIDAGWGVMNHSFNHRANHWSGPSALLSVQQAREDAFWSQVILAAHLREHRAPTGAVYANGYLGYNQGDALSEYGIGIATRVSGSSTRDVLSPNVNWMDFTRSYLDESVWSNESNKSQPMADFPDAENGGPGTNNLVIDFTHEIQRTPGSANLDRWRTRLKTIEARWGAKGTDTLWCAPSAEVADFVQAAKAATVTVSPGRLNISLPDAIPGSALTLRLTGISAGTHLDAPESGTIYRQGDTVVLTTPRIGVWGAQPSRLRLKCIYEGPAVSTNFSKPAAIAGVILRVSGNLASAQPYRVAVRTAEGEKVIAERTIGPGWVVGSQLCPIVPTASPVIGVGVAIDAPKMVNSMSVWAIDDGQ